MTKTQQNSQSGKQGHQTQEKNTPRKGAVSSSGKDGGREKEASRSDKK
jgi:hypothetical protein